MAEPFPADWPLRDWTEGWDDLAEEMRVAVLHRTVRAAEGLSELRDQLGGSELLDSIEGLLEVARRTVAPLS